MKKFYVITGGSGVGKTTLLNEFVQYKFKVVPENAREIIRHETANNQDGLPWKNKALYTSLMLKADVQSYNAISKSDS